MFFKRIPFIILALSILVFGATSVLALGPGSQSEEPQYSDSGFCDSGPPLDNGNTLSSDVASIRESLDIFLYALIPLLIAFTLFWHFCKWFYSTFISGALK